MTRRVFVYFLLTFVLGTLVGAGSTVLLFRYGRARFGKDRTAIFLRYLKRELDLTNQQAQQIQPILQEAQKSFQKLHKQTEPQYDVIRQNANARIRQLLSQVQQSKFDALVKKFEERRKRFRQRSGD